MQPRRAHGSALRGAVVRRDPLVWRNATALSCSTLRFSAFAMGMEGAPRVVEVPVRLQTLLRAVGMVATGVTAVHGDRFHKPSPTRAARLQPFYAALLRRSEAVDVGFTCRGSAMP